MRCYFTTLHNIVNRHGSFFLLFALVSGFISCGKEEPAAEEEQPFFIFFDEAAISIDTMPVAPNTWEYGFVFNTLTDGKITKMGMKLPVAGTFKARLWDLSGAAPSVLAEKSLSAGAEHATVFADIPAVPVRKNSTLGVTILADAFHRIEKQNAANFAFPLVVKNIRIVSFNENLNNSGLASFPKDTNSMRVAPCVNVVFVAD